MLPQLLPDHMPQLGVVNGSSWRKRRLWFRFYEPRTSGGESTPWRVDVLQMLVDSEALEGLWRKRQPGRTTALKTQVSGGGTLPGRWVVVRAVGVGSGATCCPKGAQ